MTNLKKQFVSGVVYTALSRYIGIFISIIVGAILARLLTPADYGTVALVTVFISFFSLLSNLGIGAAIVQNKSLNEEDFRSLFSLTLIIGCFLSVIFYLSSDFIAFFYNNDELILIAKLLSIAVLFNSFSVVPQALCLKRHDFKNQGIITIAVNLFTGILAILLAYNGFSYFALVFKSILDGVLIFFSIYYLKPIKPILFLKLKPIKSIAKFSTFQFSFNLINYFSRSSDNILIGKFLGSTTLGFYDKAYQLMMMPVLNLTHVITPVLHPVLSEYQDDKERIFKAYLKVVKILAILGFPLSIFLYFNSTEIVLLIYGNQWSNSIPIFKLLSLTIGIQMVLSSSGSIFQTLNRTDLLFVSGLLFAISMVSAILYGIFIEKTLTSIGFGIIIAFILNFFLGFYFLIVKSLNASFIIFFKTFINPLLLSFTLFIGLFIISKFSINNLFISLTLKTIVSSLIFLITFCFFDDNYSKLKFNLIKILNKNSNGK